MGSAGVQLGAEKSTPSPGDPGHHDDMTLRMLSVGRCPRVSKVALPCHWAPYTAVGVSVAHLPFTRWLPVATPMPGCGVQTSLMKPPKVLSSQVGTHLMVTEWP